MIPLIIIPQTHLGVRHVRNGLHQMRSLGENIKIMRTNMSRQFEKEEERIENDSSLSNKEKNAEIRELIRDYRAAAEDAASFLYIKPYPVFSYSFFHLLILINFQG